MKDKDYAEPYPCGEMYVPTADALKTQVSGNHYKDLPYQPVEFIEKVNMHYCCANILKYVVRFKNKNGRTDLKKALHYCELLEITGNKWWDCPNEEYPIILDYFVKFIRSNLSFLDGSQVAVVMAIMAKDMDFLKESINNLITNNYGKSESESKG